MLTKDDLILSAQKFILDPSKPYDKAREAQARSLMRLAEVVAGPSPSPTAKRGGIAYQSDAEARAMSAYLHGVKEDRDMAAGAGAFPGSGSGYFSPLGFYPAVISMMKQIDDLFWDNVVTVVQSPKGGPYAFPVLGDTSATAVVIGENQPYTNTDAFMNGTVLPTCPKWATGWYASLELVQDSGVPFDEWTAAAFAVRLQRGLGAANVSVLLAGAAKAGTAVGNAGNTGGPGTGANSIGSADLLTCISALDAAYIPGASWVMSQVTLATILGTTNKQGGLVYDIDRDMDGNLLLLDFPVRICPSMPAIATGAKPIVFGNLKRLVLREVINGMVVTPFSERAATTGQIYFRGEWRCQSALVTTNNSPADPSPAVYIQNA